MDKIVIDIEDDIIKRLLDTYEGSLPTMNLKEQKEYKSLRKEQDELYNKFIKSCDIFPFENTSKLLKDNFTQYIEFVNSMNYFLNELYFKQGFKNAINVILECVEKNK